MPHDSKPFTILLAVNAHAHALVKSLQNSNLVTVQWLVKLHIHTTLSFLAVSRGPNTDLSSGWSSCVVLLDKHSNSMSYIAAVSASVISKWHFALSKGASTLCRAVECNTLQLCRVAKVARHMPPMRSHPHERRIFCRPSGYQNCVTRSANLVSFFSQTG